MKDFPEGSAVSEAKRVGPWAARREERPEADAGTAGNIVCDRLVKKGRMSRVGTGQLHTFWKEKC